MDAETIRTCAEIGTTIGTLVLALATYRFTIEVSTQAKRDRINREMDLLISPLMIAYREIESRGKDGDWWKLYTGEMHIQTNQIAAQRFRDAIKSVDLYRYLAPEKLRPLIDEFVFRLRDMEREKDPGNLYDFQSGLIKATNALYYSTNVLGGLVEYRRYELTKELDALNKDLISKAHDLFRNTWLRLYRKPRPPKLMQPT